MNKYLIGSGYAESQESTGSEFSNLWRENIDRYANPKPSRVVVLAVGGNRPNIPNTEIIGLGGNLGHVHNCIKKWEPHKPYHFCGWSAAIVTLAMIAYCDESDFIFLEQDALAFGPWVEQLYQEIGSHKVIFGKLAHMPCAQSLFMVKHDYIPDFVRLYLNTGSEQLVENLPEHKFMWLLNQHPLTWKQFSFGVDRDRPLPYDAPVWYCQKITPEELAELKTRKLI